MELYLGGAGSGKLQYVMHKISCNYPDAQHVVIADGANATDMEMMKCDILNHFHLWVRNNIQDADHLHSRLQDILRNNPDICIICDEVGCGIVPMDATERQYRELTGRLCCNLAEEAVVVERVLFGIAQKLK